MTAPLVEQTGYASVSDYELRTGIDVPESMNDTYQTWLNDASSLMALYMGPECAEKVEAAYPDVLTSLCVQRVQRMASVPPGVVSSSVGGTSVSYAQPEGAAWLSAGEQDMLDRLMDAVCGPVKGVQGVGELGVGWGGPPEEGDSETLWWLTRPPGPWYR